MNAVSDRQLPIKYVASRAAAVGFNEVGKVQIQMRNQRFKSFGQIGEDDRGG
jgi:hypothetical protein